MLLVPDPSGSADRPLVPQKRKVSSPTHSSNGHSPTETAPSPLKKKKKPGVVNSNSKDQVGEEISPAVILLHTPEMMGLIMILWCSFI